jgi:hypothetical protein
MARSGKLTQNEEPPSGWKPTQAVPDPVLHSLYEEPSRHWECAHGVASIAPYRRPASYFKGLRGRNSNFWPPVGPSLKIRSAT